MCAIPSRAPTGFSAARSPNSLAAAKIPKARIDGLAVASFTLAPDTAVGLTQHLGLTVRWLDHVPMGGASGIVSIRRAARAVQSGDAEIVACIAGDTNHTDSFRRNTSAFSQFSQDAVYPYGSGGPNASFAFLTAYYMRTYGATARGFRQAVRRAAQQRAEKSAGFVQKAADARALSQRAPRRRSAPSVRLRDAVRRRGRFSGDAARDRRRHWACGSRGFSARSSGTTRFPTIRCSIAAAGRWIATRFTRRRAFGPDDIDFLETYDDYPVINVLQFEGLGFCPEGEGPAFIRANTFETDGSFSVQYLGRAIVGRPSRRGRRASRYCRSHSPAYRRDRSAPACRTRGTEWSRASA